MASPKVTLPVVASVVNEPAPPPPVISLVIATVPDLFGNVIVLSAVGSVTVKVVSKLSAVLPSNTTLPPTVKFVILGLASRAIAILLSLTVVVILLPPSKFSVSVAKETVSFDPLSAPTVNDVVILAVDIDVTSPFALAVITGIAVELPVALVSEFTVASVIAPLDDTVASPLKSPCVSKLPVELGKVIVLSAVGSVTAKVVSKLSAVLPSNTIVGLLIVGLLRVGLVSVLFVKVSVVSCPTKVVVALGNVTVLSAVGSVTVKVVSKLSAVLPSNIKLPVVVALPVIAGVVKHY